MISDYFSDDCAQGYEFSSVLSRWNFCFVVSWCGDERCFQIVLKCFSALTLFVSTEFIKFCCSVFICVYYEVETMGVVQMFSN